MNTVNDDLEEIEKDVSNKPFRRLDSFKNQEPFDFIFLGRTRNVITRVRVEKKSNIHFFTLSSLRCRQIRLHLLLRIDHESWIIG